MGYGVPEVLTNQFSNNSPQSTGDMQDIENRNTLIGACPDSTSQLPHSPSIATDWQGTAGAAGGIHLAIGHPPDALSAVACKYC